MPSTSPFAPRRRRWTSRHEAGDRRDGRLSPRRAARSRPGCQYLGRDVARPRHGNTQPDQGLLLRSRRHLRARRALRAGRHPGSRGRRPPGRGRGEGGTRRRGGRARGTRARRARCARPRQAIRRADQHRHVAGVRRRGRASPKAPAWATTSVVSPTRTTSRSPRRRRPPSSPRTSVCDPGSPTPIPTTTT